MGIPGVLYNFNNQNLVNFEGNIGNKGDLPLVAYMDFETTAPVENFLTPEQNKMFVVSYELIFTFHSKLKLSRVFVQRSFGHSLLKLATIDYLNEDQLKFVDKDLKNQPKNCAINVSERWFDRKFKIQNMEIDHEEKITYEAFNPMDWKKAKCVICNFPLIINAKGPNVPANEMSLLPFTSDMSRSF